MKLRIAFGCLMATLAFSGVLESAARRSLSATAGHRSFYSCIITEAICAETPAPKVDQLQNPVTGQKQWCAMVARCAALAWQDVERLVGASPFVGDATFMQPMLSLTVNEKGILTAVSVDLALAVHSDTGPYAISAAKLPGIIAERQQWLMDLVCAFVDTLAEAGRVASEVALHVYQPAGVSVNISGLTPYTVHYHTLEGL